MVTLSGGDLGGTRVDAADWADDTDKTFDGGYIYRRRGDIAVFYGMSK